MKQEKLRELLGKCFLKLISLAVYLVKLIGKLHLPYTHKEVTGKDVYAIKEHLVPGSILLSYTKGELSNLFIQGEFTHCAIVKDKDSVIEAVGPTVRENDLISFMTSKDRVALLTPIFADREKMDKAVEIAQSCLNAPYDYIFCHKNEAFYCSELIQFCYEMAGCKEFIKRKRFDLYTVLPDDFAQAETKWKLVWDSDLL